MDISVDISQLTAITTYDDAGLPPRKTGAPRKRTRKHHDAKRTRGGIVLTPNQVFLRDFLARPETSCHLHYDGDKYRVDSTYHSFQRLIDIYELPLVIQTQSREAILHICKEVL